MTIHPIGHTNALIYALAFLEQSGVEIVPEPDRASHILLPVPSFDENGNVKGGVSLPPLRKDTVIIGGSLDRPELAGYECIDLMADELYVAKNAMITAHCALRYAMEALSVTLEGCPVLVIGFGRIGKCLAKLLDALGANVTVAARKHPDLALAQALGYASARIEAVAPSAFRLILNTVPVMVLPDGGSAVKIDLASKPGIGGQHVLWARGLPGKDAPESSGKLIAETVLRLIG